MTWLFDVLIRFEPVVVMAVGVVVLVKPIAVVSNVDDVVNTFAVLTKTIYNYF
jgi:hypothetical protein